ncbi:aldehyde dehydrogenase (NADP(+)) [Mucilaginibacter sp.]|uniref:aldehyde dehydrogenase (NADP(+)) n=1 Tax=Mucilaginibacter sp. TaxID=1882438 RepID=UPI00283CA351|nr:aldehyde dehydrogenase (NADP(+)) [Mucilaginibacter sp.]MDR3697653.1 aldehyde dehydrogenase (NADP(+)) [Mucilaginibacter sp.]
MKTQNLAGYKYLPNTGKKFNGFNPATGTDLPGDFYPATLAEVDEAMNLADKAFAEYRHIDRFKKAAFLRSIADEINALGDELIERAMAETGLPAPRLQGERARTTNQMYMFAQLVEEGSWVEAIVDTAIPDRKPLPRLDIRQMKVPVGPAVVFGASNFPLAYSVAGGDTAAALASGCPVVVKAHPAHPGTGALVASAVKKAAEQNNMPEGVFSILYDSGYAIGEALVKHPKTKIVTFTGSLRGGMALVKMANERDEPIPVFAEMGSINPVVFMPQAMEARAEELAKIAGPITINAGQFCTQPGLLIAVKSAALERFKTALAGAIAEISSTTMLTPGICANFSKLSGERLSNGAVSIVAQSDVKGAELANQGQPIVTEISAADFLADPQFKEEVFGPFSLLVVADDMAQVQQVVGSLHGQLTASIMAEPGELENYKQLTDTLANLAGRVILNGPPTGVEVGNAIVHGGPFPATTDSRFTSVGTTSIKRFVRPVCWQNWSEELLPDELKTNNPLKIWRLFNNEWMK